MPVVIGAKPESSFTDPVGLLTDCHRRIERFLGVLQHLAQSASRQLTNEERKSLETALNYFRNSAPKHTADEEESLFPRLRSINRPALEAVMSDLQKDHLQADESHAQVDRLGQLWLKTGSLDQHQAERFAAILSDLSNLYTRHIALEERELFPVANKLLPAAQREAIGVEMKSRRT
jgi:hemerythrin-like domain-containing protein